MHGRCLLLPLLLSVACGGRTGVGLSLDSSPAGSGSVDGQSGAGTNGRAPAANWDAVTWEGPWSLGAVYLWSGSPTNAWAVVSAGAGDGGGFYRQHWDGVGWSQTSSTQNPNHRFDDEQIWGASSSVAFGGSSRNVQRWSGSAWLDWDGTPACTSLGGTAENDLWCGGADLIWHFDGALWTSWPLAGVKGVTAVAPRDVWAWGELGAAHFDGNGWQSALTGAVRAVSASAPDDVWAVQDGDLLHCAGAGTPWSRQNPTGALISGVWSQSRTNTWIVAAGTAMRFDGTAWTAATLPARDEWLLLAGSSEDIWLGGTLLLVHGRAGGVE